MLVHLLAAAAAAAGPASTQPTVSGLSLFVASSGSCSATTPKTVASPAALRASWSGVNPNDVLYEIHIAFNGGVPTVQATTASTTATLTLTGLVQGDTANAASRTDTVVVTVVRKSDSVAVQSISTSFTSSYGTCS